MIGVLDDQDRVLGHEPDQHDEPDLRVDVDRQLEREQRDEGAEHRERDGEQDRERVDEALELGCEHQVDEHQRDQEQEVEPAARLDELA